MPKILVVTFVLWLALGVLLLAANTFCSGENCTEGEWYGTIFGLIAWGLVGVPLVLVATFVAIQSMLGGVRR